MDNTHEVVQVWWKDICEHINSDVDGYKDQPMVEVVSTGILIDNNKDKDGTMYIKLCHKLAVDGSKGNDDWIAIPLGCVSKIRVVGIYKEGPDEITTN